MYGKLHIKHPTAIIIRPETFRTRSDGSIYRLIKRPIAIPNSIPAFALSFTSTPQTPTCMFPMYQSMTLIYHRLSIQTDQGDCQATQAQVNLLHDYRGGRQFSAENLPKNMR